MACSGQNITPGKRAKDKEIMLFQLLLHRADLTSRTEQGDMRPGLSSPFCRNPAERPWTSNLSGPQFTSLSSKINTIYSSYPRKVLGEENRRRQGSPLEDTEKEPWGGRG